MHRYMPEFILLSVCLSIYLSIYHLSFIYLPIINHPSSIIIYLSITNQFRLALQAYLGENAGSGPDHCNNANIAVR